jgi:FtsZ-interacting cell division protein ZipA
MFHCAADDGSTVFTLGNLEPALFAPDEMKRLSTHGLTFTLDVPRVADGVGAFERMVGLGRRLAESLEGDLVDDNRAPLNEKSLEFIRGKIAEFQRQMGEQGIPAGSDTAQRLFS